LDFGQPAADETDIAVGRLWAAKLLDVPLPVPVLGLCGESADQPRLRQDGEDVRPGNKY